MAHCLITGGTRGIGAATALLAAQHGHELTLIARNVTGPHVDQLVRAIRALGRQVQVLKADMAEAAEVVQVFADAQSRFGRVGALVNAAGMGHNARVELLDADEVMRLLSVNVLGTMLFCREAVRSMSMRHGGEGWAIVNVSSMAATIGGRPGASAYAASKAAVDCFTTGFAREVAAEGIRVNVVRPGVVDTDMTRHVMQDPALLARVAASIPMQRVGQPEEVAEVVVWLLSSAASLVTGAHVDAGGGGFMVQPLT